MIVEGERRLILRYAAPARFALASYLRTFAYITVRTGTMITEYTVCISVTKHTAIDGRQASIRVTAAISSRPLWACCFGYTNHIGLTAFSRRGLLHLSADKSF